MNEIEKYRNVPLKRVRELVIEQLKFGYAHDHLEEEEFESRLERVHVARTKDALISIVSDLPEIKESDQLKTQNAGVSFRLNRGHVKEKGVIFAVMGGAERGGAWKPPRHLTVAAIMGGVDLNFSKAELAPGTTEILIFCMMGGVDIIVPPGLNVDIVGFPIMGGFEDRSSGSVDPNAPVLKIRGFALMGGVSVKEPKKKIF